MMDTIQYQLQQFDPGIVWLDARNIITAMNGVASEILGDRAGQLIGEEVVQIHPEKSRQKVKFLFDRASCLADSSQPITMMINIPERVLLVDLKKVSCIKAEGHYSTLYTEDDDYLSTSPCLISKAGSGSYTSFASMAATW